MRLGGAPQPAIVLNAGPSSNCLSFGVTQDGHLPDEVGYDIAARGTTVQRRVSTSDQPLLGRDSADSSACGLPPFRWKLSGEGAGKAATLDAMVRARSEEYAMKVRASGELDGTLYGRVLQVGRTVTVDGVGDRYGGTYYVDSVTHVFSADGYQQSFRLRRNALGDDNGPGGGDKLAALE